MNNLTKALDELLERLYDVNMSLYSGRIGIMTEEELETEFSDRGVDGMDWEFDELKSRYGIDYIRERLIDHYSVEQYEALLTK